MMDSDKGGLKNLANKSAAAQKPMTVPPPASAVKQLDKANGAMSGKMSSAVMNLKSLGGILALARQIQPMAQ